MLNTTVRIGGLTIHQDLYNFVENEIFTSFVQPNVRDTISENDRANVQITGVNSSQFWEGLERTFRTLKPAHTALLQARQQFQNKINTWCISQRKALEQGDHILLYKTFLYNIGYLVPISTNDVQETISVQNIDDDIALKPGPQLIVPLGNPHAALFGTNSRWNSLFDALYYSDIALTISSITQTNTTPSDRLLRLKEVFKYGIQLLDDIIPLMKGSYINIISVRLHKSISKLDCVTVEFILQNQNEFSHFNSTYLQDDNLLIGYSGGIYPCMIENPTTPFSLLFLHHSLYIEVMFDPNKNSVYGDHHFLMDIIFESCITCIQDCEDSVAAVDVKDKINIYRNWNQLTQGNLQVNIQTSDKNNILIQKMNPDRVFTPVSGGMPSLILRGRPLLLLRHVGYHVYSNIIKLTETHEWIPEAFLDGFITALISTQDIYNKTALKNSNTGSMYVISPKLHGPAEVQLTNTLFSFIEDILYLPRYTIKCGITDEERRTSLNLKLCIKEIQQRLFLIHTGCIDRIADEIYTHFYLGPVQRNKDLKHSSFFDAYKKQSVFIAFQSKCMKKCLIGDDDSGTWRQSKTVQDILSQKIQHLQSGATSSCVPSARAACLHAINYHYINIFQIQTNVSNQCLKHSNTYKHESPYLNTLLHIPILNNDMFVNQTDIYNELEHNLHQLLSYIVQWIQNGIGYSTLLNMYGKPWLQDKSIVRLLSLHIANWLHHGIISQTQLFHALRQMAQLIDNQHINDMSYNPMSKQLISSIAFNTAIDVIFKVYSQPSGYVEYILNPRRQQAKHYKSKANPNATGLSDCYHHLASHCKL